MGNVEALSSIIQQLQVAAIPTNIKAARARQKMNEERGAQEIACLGRLKAAPTATHIEEICSYHLASFGNPGNSCS